jgi:hypothetical protein
MNLYDEFFSIVPLLNELGIRYAVVGGIALAFHGNPRFTMDIDVLVDRDDMDRLQGVLGALGYEESAEPWMFPGTAVTLRRFLKFEGEDQMAVDVLVADTEEHRRMIRDAVQAESSRGGVPVARKRDLITLKRLRNSPQDRVDIMELESDDEDREGGQNSQRSL